MPTIPEFMLNTAVEVEAYEGETGQSGPKYAEPVTLRGHWEPKRQLVVKREGREVHGAALLILAPGAVIPPESRVTYGGRVYRVLYVAELPAPGGGVHHLEIVLG